MPLFDFKCPICGLIKLDVLVKSSTEEVWCEDRGVSPLGPPALMERLPGAPAIKVEGYSAKNGYHRVDHGNGIRTEVREK